MTPKTAQGGAFNQTAFVIQQFLNKVQTSTLVQVVAVSEDGQFVDVLPMVNQIDGAGNAVPHVTIYNVPCFRYQGGSNAVTIRPVIGDIGPALFASRDLTKVKNTRAVGNPGSLRTFSYSDALYIGGMLNGEPTQHITLDASGITIHSPIGIVLEAPSITITGPLTITGDLTQTGDIALDGSMLATGTVHASNIP